MTRSGTRYGLTVNGNEYQFPTPERRAEFRAFYARNPEAAHAAYVKAQEVTA